MLTNYHTHCQFCDGKASARQMALAAYTLGFQVLGFSSHSPLPFYNEGNMQLSQLEEYCQTISLLVQEWRPKGLEILVGMEIEYIPNICGPTDSTFANLGLAYSIASVHFVDVSGSGLFAVDLGADLFQAKMEKQKGGEPVWAVYYRNICELIQMGGFSILGHFDLIKKNNKNNRWFDEDSKEYLHAAFEAVELLQGRDIIVEINLGGMARGKVETPYPSLPILKVLRQNKVSITFSADAHETSHLGMYIEQGKEFAKAAGYTECRILTGGKWIDIPIDHYKAKI